MRNRKPLPEDRIVGANLRGIRNGLGLTMDEAGKKVGVSRQQIEKYESGEDRVSAGILARLSHLYDVALPRFFDGVATGENLSPLPSSGSTCIAARIDRLPQYSRVAIDRTISALERGI